MKHKTVLCSIIALAVPRTVNGTGHTHKTRTF